MKRLVLIDGKSVFYRGYYAMGALSLRDGTPTGGIYGFAAIAMEIVGRLDPTKVVVAWDSKSSTSKRKAIFADYKAGRVKPGDDFYAQIPLLEQLIRNLGWEFVELDNYEADDIIGTLSREADRAGDYETYIISSDLDMLQIVDENTHMWRILKGFTNIEQIDIPELEEKYGIKKSQFLDLKSLKGDSSDNIPGVPGIGEKTAAKLLNEYGSLDGIYEHLDSIKGSTKTKLEFGRDSAYMSKKLATIMFDAPLDLSQIPDFHFDKDQIIAGLKKLEFNSLIRKVEKATGPDDSGGRATASNESGESGDRNASFEGPKTWPSGRVTALEGDPQLSFSEDGGGKAGRTRPGGQDGTLGAEPEKKAFWQDPTDTADRTRTADMTPPSIISWDIKSLMHSDPAVAKRILGGETFWDLSQAAFLLNPLRTPDPELVIPEDEYRRQLAAFRQVPSLYRVLTLFDLPLIPVLYKMEEKGMLIDRDYFKSLQEEYIAEVAQIEQKIYSTVGKEFNINSPIQLSEILFTTLGLPVKGIKKTTKGYSTGAKELEKLRTLHPVVEQIIEYREAAKLLNTYILPMPTLADADDRIHTTFTQNVTATGRLSSKDPNLQNIPVRTEEGKRIRTGFIAPKGRVLVSADYSQFELRLAAALSNDQPLIDDFNHDIDIHTKTASEAFHVPFAEVTKDQRRAAKVVNFGILYGMSVKGLADAAHMPIPEAKAFIDNYFALRAPIKQKLDQILTDARTKGYVETFFGRRRPTPDVKSPNFLIRTAAERAASNMPIQGTEADLMKRAMIQVDAALPDTANLIMQVHDSLIIECDEKDATRVTDILRAKMESVAPELPVKLAVDVTIGHNWGEL